MMRLSLKKWRDGGRKPFQGLRARMLSQGDQKATEQLIGHVRKWQGRGMADAKIAKKLGVSVGFVVSSRVTPATGPRLVKKSQ
jgi:hypothetical protein